MNKTRRLVVSGVLVAIMLVLGMTRLGFIPVGPVYATTLHIPVLIGAICFNRRTGLILGAVFGIYSLINAYINPTVISFIFMNPVVSIIPRIIFPLFAYYVFRFLVSLPDKKREIIVNTIFLVILIASIYNLYRAVFEMEIKFLSVFIPVLMIIMSIILWVLNHKKNNVLGASSTAAFIGSLINTILVVGLMYIIYLKPYALAVNVDIEKAKGLLLGIAVFHGLPEAVLGAILTGAIAYRKDKYAIND